MHLSSVQHMREFCERYLAGKRGKPLRVFDLGGSNIGGTYRDLFDDPAWTYVGVDVVSNENVDIVLDDPYCWKEVDSESFDIFISGQTFEHIGFFWLTILEVKRILKPGGLCCIIAPSAGPEHRYPVDCWRFYPDGFRALAEYGGLESLEILHDPDPQEYADDSALWKDTVLIGRKPESEQGEHIYQGATALTGSDSLTLMTEQIRPGSTVLELGPATGYLTRHLKEKLDCVVDCVEYSQAMADKAEPFCRTMVRGDLNELDLPATFAPGSYDYILMADVLEHLFKDAEVLSGCRELLKDDGRLLLSVPNVGHAAVLGELLQGNFPYTEEGLLDTTHVRFYTRSSILELLTEAGYGVEAVGLVEKRPEETEMGNSLAELPRDVERFILQGKDALVYQFVIAATKHGDIKPELKLPSMKEVSTGYIRILNDKIAETEALVRTVQYGLKEAEGFVREREAEIEGLHKEKNALQEELAELYTTKEHLEGRVHELNEALDETKETAQDRLDDIHAKEAIIQEIAQAREAENKAAQEEIAALRHGLQQAEELALSRMEELGRVYAKNKYVEQRCSLLQDKLRAVFEHPSFRYGKFLMNKELRHFLLTDEPEE